ncbi:MAG: hypothetical protein IT582_00390, partial [Opitutaceae bacterium]|nr:hypothetical protein [Opitutaceae bacterium]
MTIRLNKFFFSVLVALAFTLIPTDLVWAQTAAPESPATETPTAAPEEPATEAKATGEESAAALENGEMRRLDEPGEAVAPAADYDQSAATITPAVTIGDEPAEPEEEDDAADHRAGSSEAVLLGDQVVPTGNTVLEMVSIFGNATLDGESLRAVVSVFGNTTVNGRSGREAVSVLGNTTVNGEVGGEAVAVLGDIKLGPKAVVHGDVVTVGGRLIREDGSVVHGNVQEINLFHGASLDWLKTWFYRCALWGRPLAFGQDLVWAWTIAIGVFAMYVFLALLFPRAFEKCAETFEQRPGYSLLTMLLSVLLTPILFVLLAITGIGIILIPFLAAAVFFGTLFGKAVVHAWLGRRITRYFGGGAMNHVAMATLVGSVIILLLYTVPFLGFFLWKVLGMLGLGIVVYTLILTTRKEAAATAAAAPANVSTPPVLGAEAAVGNTPISSLPR